MEHRESTEPIEMDQGGKRPDPDTTGQSDENESSGYGKKRKPKEEGKDEAREEFIDENSEDKEKEDKKTKK